MPQAHEPLFFRGRMCVVYVLRTDTVDRALGMKTEEGPSVEPWTHAAACERATLCSQHNNKHALSTQNGRKLNLLPGVSTAGSAFPKVLHHLPAFFRLFSLVVEDNNTDSSDMTPPFINVACVKLAWLV